MATMIAEAIAPVLLSPDFPGNFARDVVENRISRLFSIQYDNSSRLFHRESQHHFHRRHCWIAIGNQPLFQCALVRD